MYFNWYLFVQSTSESQTQHDKDWMEFDFNYADDHCISHAGNILELIEKTSISDIDTCGNGLKKILWKYM